MNPRVLKIFFIQMKIFGPPRLLLRSIFNLIDDTQPENLLVYEYPDSTRILKLCDFGLATEIHRKEKLTFVCGTATYVAPEIITGVGYGVQVDTWAAGIIIYILLCGFPVGFLFKDYYSHVNKILPDEEVPRIPNNYLFFGIFQLSSTS